MRIGMDVTAAAGNLIGVGEYIVKILEYLLLHQIECFLFYRTKPKYKIFNEARNVKHIIPHSREYKKVDRSYWEQFILPHLINKYKIDIYHAPYNFGIPIFSDCPSIITIHDIIPAFLPLEKFPSYFILEYKVFPGLSLIKANHAIAVSNTTKRDLEKFYKIPKSKITVIYNGVNSIYQPTQNNKILNRYKKKFNLKDNFIVYLSNINPRKNHERLIKAFAKFRLKSKNNFQLLIIGEGNKENLLPLRNLAKSVNLSNEIIFTGYLSLEDIPILLSTAKLMIYPSLYEGFGLPLLEAMACGCPVACSNTSSLPEVAGEAAYLFNPYNIKSIVDAMFKCINENALRQKMVKKGFERIKDFSWRKTQEETFKIYLSLVNKKKL